MSDVRPHNLKSGQFAYIYIQESIEFVLKNGVTLSTAVDIQINVDGLPLYKSSRVNIWPILKKIDGYKQPLPVALFCGIGKPELEPFMTQLCQEIQWLKSQGILC